MNKRLLYWSVVRRVVVFGGIPVGVMSIMFWFLGSNSDFVELGALYCFLACVAFLLGVQADAKPGEEIT